jgi:hypothetical protein
MRGPQLRPGEHVILAIRPPARLPVLTGATAMTAAVVEGWLGRVPWIAALASAATLMLWALRRHGQVMVTNRRLIRRSAMAAQELRLDAIRRIDADFTNGAGTLVLETDGGRRASRMRITRVSGADWVLGAVIDACQRAGGDPHVAERAGRPDP